jgi:hypothetical protein
MSTILPLLFVAAVAMSSDGRHAPKPVGGGLAGVSCGCPGDFDHTGTIDGADLATLLGGWGSAATDLDGNGFTDAADLSILLGGWGPCGSAPVNDLCADAQPIEEGDTPFCTIGADTDGPTYPSGSACIEFGYNNMTADVWYVYTAPGKGTVTLSTCGATWDTRLAVYTAVFSQTVGCPTSGPDLIAEIACNDDAPGCGMGSQVTFDTMPGKEYRIRVGGYLGWSGDGVLHLNFDPIGSSCETAIDLGLVIDAWVGGTTEDDNPGVDISPCGVGDTVAQWFRFYPEGCILDWAHVTVSTCLDGTEFDTTLSVWKASPTGCIGEFVGCNDDFIDSDCQIGGLNRKSHLQFDAPPQTAYYVRVSGYAGAQGHFQLRILSECY